MRAASPLGRSSVQAALPTLNAACLRRQCRLASCPVLALSPVGGARQVRTLAKAQPLAARLLPSFPVCQFSPELEETRAETRE